MKKLLSMELKRAVFSPVLWIGCAAVILKNVYGILLCEYGFTIYTTSFLFSNSGFICIIMAILLSYCVNMVLRFILHPFYFQIPVSSASLWQFFFRYILVMTLKFVQLIIR